MTSCQLKPVQRLPTSAARAVEPFEIAGQTYLAVAQMSKDVPGQPASLNGGSSDTVLPIYQWLDGKFVLHQQLPVPGGEDAEFFSIGERHFLATASLRSGDGPYLMDVYSVVFEWLDGRFEPFQRFASFAAKQWRHFCIKGRHFLALAQGVVLPGVQGSHPAESCIFEWNGAQFVAFQTLSASQSAWGYNWQHVEINGQHFLAYADHIAPSHLLRWTGVRFDDFQQFEEKSGRAFCFFEQEQQHWLVFANLLGDSFLYRWVDGRFKRHQKLCGPGAREMLWLPEHGGQLVQTNFLLGSREAPQPMDWSCIYSFQGGQLVQTATFESSGAVDAASFSNAGKRYLVIANSLSQDLRFCIDSVVYQLPGEGA